MNRFKYFETYIYFTEWIIGIASLVEFGFDPWNFLNFVIMTRFRKFEIFMGSDEDMMLNLENSTELRISV